MTEQACMDDCGALAYTGRLPEDSKSELCHRCSEHNGTSRMGKPRAVVSATSMKTRHDERWIAFACKLFQGRCDGTKCRCLRRTQSSLELAHVLVSTVNDGASLNGVYESLVEAPITSHNFTPERPQPNVDERRLAKSRWNIESAREFPLLGCVIGCTNLPCVGRETVNLFEELTKVWIRHFSASGKVSAVPCSRLAPQLDKVA
uniref:hypothetical protein n=1 Tax=Pseudoclavibacter albus TaxID=272241 RepID=UPI001F155806|nr:hypothetical protein [Pseudoclavibacter alba]